MPLSSSDEMGQQNVIVDCSDIPRSSIMGFFFSLQLVVNIVEEVLCPGSAQFCAANPKVG